MGTKLLLLFVVGQLAIMSPGPDFFLVLRNSLRCTRRAALATAWGISSGFCVHVTYCALGLSAALIRHPELVRTLKVVGALYLIWIGLGALRSRGLSRRPDSSASEKMDDPRAAFFEGLCCNLLNPKVALFLLGVFTQVVGAETTATELAAYVAVLVAQCFVYWPTVALLIVRSRAGGWLERNGRRFDRAFGAILLLLGIELGLS